MGWRAARGRIVLWSMLCIPVLSRRASAEPPVDPAAPAQSDRAVLTSTADVPDTGLRFEFWNIVAPGLSFSLVKRLQITMAGVPPFGDLRAYLATAKLALVNSGPVRVGAIAGLWNWYVEDWNRSRLRGAGVIATVGPDRPRAPSLSVGVVGGHEDSRFEGRSTNRKRTLVFANSFLPLGGKAALLGEVAAAGRLTAFGIGLRMSPLSGRWALDLAVMKEAYALFGSDGVTSTAPVIRWQWTPHAP